MTIGQPKALTAIVHLEFDYGEAPTDKSQPEILTNLMDKVFEMDPTLAEMLMKFAEYVQKTGERKRA